MNTNYLLFQIYPYCSIIIFIIVILPRKNNKQYILKKQIRNDYGTWFNLGNKLFHWSAILLMVGHLIGLFTPKKVYLHIISVEKKQALAIFLGGTLGVICFIGLTVMIIQRLFNKQLQSTNTASRVIILFLVYIQLILGLLTIPVSFNHPDGQEMLNLTRWIQHIVIFDSSAYKFLTLVHWIYKIHILLGMTILVIFPFTRLAYAIKLPLKNMTDTRYIK